MVYIGKGQAVDETTAKIVTICECVDQCFSFHTWCGDFARHVDAEDMMMGLAHGHELVSNATRLYSFFAVRKLDDFLRSVRSRKDDLIAADLAIDPDAVLAAADGYFITDEDRTKINKGAAHLTQQLTLDADSEVDLSAILNRSIPILEHLAEQLRNQDKTGEATRWLDQTDALIASHKDRLGEAAISD